MSGKSPSACAQISALCPLTSVPQHPHRWHADRSGLSCGFNVTWDVSTLSAGPGGTQQPALKSQYMLRIIITSMISPGDRRCVRGGKNSLKIHLRVSQWTDIFRLIKRGHEIILDSQGVIVRVIRHGQVRAFSAGEHAEQVWELTEYHLKTSCLTGCPLLTQNFFSRWLSL